MKAFLSMAILVSIFGFFACTAIAQQISGPSHLLSSAD